LDIAKKKFLSSNAVPAAIAILLILPLAFASNTQQVWPRLQGAGAGNIALFRAGIRRPHSTHLNRSWNSSNGAWNFSR